MKWLPAYKTLISLERVQLDKLYNKHYPESFETAIAQINSLNESSVLREYFHIVMKSGKTETDLIDYAEWIHWPRYLAGIFVFIGLFGTVWGIAHAVTSLGLSVQGASSSTSVENMQGLAQGIYNLLSSISYASICTLAGLLATVIMSLLNSIYIHNANALITKARSLAENRYIKFYVDSTPNNEVIITDELRSSIDALKKMSESLANQINPAAEYLANIQKSTNAVVECFNKSYAEFKDEIKQVRAIYKKISDVLATITADNFTSLQGAADALSITAKHFQEERSVVSTAADKVSSSALQMERSIRELREAMLVSSDSQSAKLEIFVSDVKSTKNSLDAVLRNFERTLLDFNAIPEQSGLRIELSRLATELNQFSGVLESSVGVHTRSSAQQMKLTGDVEALQRLFSNWEDLAQKLLTDMRTNSSFPAFERFEIGDDIDLADAYTSKRKHTERVLEKPEPKRDKSKSLWSRWFGGNGK